MRKLIGLSLIALLSTSFPSAQAASTIKVKNCVNIKSGNARVVPNETLTCKKGEKLIKFSYPAPVTPSSGKDGSTILSGTTDPSKDIGKIGDFYFDTKFRWMYGPKTESGWGSGFSMLGGGGGGGVGPKGDSGADGLIPKYGWAYDKIDRVASAINTAIPLYTNTIGDNSHGVTIDTSTAVINVTATGMYNLSFSSQIYNSDSMASATFSVWLQTKKHSVGTWTNVPWSNTDIEIVKKEGTGRKVAAWNFFQQIATDDDVRIVWQTTALTLYINSSAAAGIKPEIPGTILTVNQVG